MGFIFSNALKTMSKEIKINAVIALTLFVAYLFFFLGCCYVEDGIRDMDSFKLRQMEDSIYYRSLNSFKAGPADKIPDEDFRAFFDQYDFIEETAVIERNYMEDQISGESFSYFLVPPNYADFFLFDVVDGRYFTQGEMERGAKVCVVENSLRDIKNIGVGDFVTIGGIELEVVGVMRRNADGGTVFIPDRAMEGAGARNQDFQGYIVTATLEQGAQRFEIDWNRLGLNGELHTAREFYDQGVRFFLARSATIFIVCAVLLFYALLNLLNIMKSKLESQKKSLGIRLAIGASYRQMFLQFFFECLILVLVAVGAIFLLEPVISLVVKSKFNHTFGWYSAVAMLAASVLSSWFISRALLRKLKKMDVIQIIKNL